MPTPEFLAALDREMQEERKRRLHFDFIVNDPA